jgi:hypothetical protein
MLLENHAHGMNGGDKKRQRRLCAKAVALCRPPVELNGEDDGLVCCMLKHLTVTEGHCFLNHFQKKKQFLVRAAKPWSRSSDFFKFIVLTHCFASSFRRIECGRRLFCSALHANTDGSSLVLKHRDS